MTPPRPVGNKGSEPWVLTPSMVPGWTERQRSKGMKQLVPVVLLSACAGQCSIGGNEACCGWR